MTAAAISKGEVTGLVLAGGRGSRMGGVDKGLQLHRGIPLAQHALQRLAPQVGPLMLNANRHLDAYAAMGAPVWPDPMPDHPGPLAGLLAGLRHCGTRYLASVPCDTPNFPADLVARLGEALLAEGAPIAYAVAREPGAEAASGAAGGAALGREPIKAHPVFCLLRADLADGLDTFLRQGERKVRLWMDGHRALRVPFDDPAAFVNVNTLDDLARLQPPEPEGPQP